MGMMTESAAVNPFTVSIFNAGGESITMDARPSDAIALALRWDCPIFVDRKVLGQTRQNAGAADVNVNEDQLRKWLENLNEDDTGQYKM